MNHGIARIVGVLGAVMIGSIAFWELLERQLWAGEAPGLFTLIRGGTTGILMASLAVWLMARYRRGYERILRRQSEEADRTRQFFENIVQDAGEGIVSLDDHGRVTSWNRAAESIYGYRTDEMIGRTLDHLVPPDLRDEGELENLDAEVDRRGFVRDVETRRVRKDGDIRTVRITRSALRDGDGQVVGSTAMVRDVTAEKQMETRLIQTEKLAAVGQAGASIAHEVRNALAGISGAVQILRRSPAWRDLPEGFAEEVDLQVGRMAGIVDDLLTYARQGPLHTQPADVHRLLQGAIGVARHMAEAERRTVKLDLGAADPCAEVDPAWLEQAFRNIVTNAFHAMSPGGTLAIDTRRRGDELEIRFRDDGPGMEPQVRERAFDPFFTTKARGTGLGLPIVRTILEAHRGTVRLGDAPDGRGTEVILTLPALETQAEEPPASRAASMAGRVGATAAAALLVAVLAAGGLAAASPVGGSPSGPPGATAAGPGS